MADYGSERWDLSIAFFQSIPITKSVCGYFEMVEDGILMHGVNGPVVMAPCETWERLTTFECDDVRNRLLSLCLLIRHRHRYRVSDKGTFVFVNPSAVESKVDKGYADPVAFPFSSECCDAALLIVMNWGEYIRPSYFLLKIKINRWSDRALLEIILYGLHVITCRIIIDYCGEDCL